MVRILLIAAAFALLMRDLGVAQAREFGVAQAREEGHEEDHHPPARQHPGTPPRPVRPVAVPHEMPPTRQPIVGQPHDAPHLPAAAPMAAAHPAAVGQFNYRGRSIERVHREPFIYPHGWGYRRWAVGAVLPEVFLVPAYFYLDWAALGLEPPPMGDQWVRYGPDLLLVDTGTGEILEVIYDVFA